FRHALMREAAYALLTDADRALGHRLAAEWLSSRGEPDAFTLAEHFRKGGQSEKSGAFYLRAAEQALEGNDFAAALARVERGLEGAEGERRARLLIVAAEARNWQGDFPGAEEASLRAAALLERGSPAWCLAIAQLSIGCARRGNLGRLIEIEEEVRNLMH